MSQGNKVEINEENYVDYLINSLKIAQSRGKLEIKESSLLNKVFKVTKNPDLAKELGLEELDKNACISTLVKSIVIANQRGAYTFEDSEAIDILFNFIEKHNKKE